MKEFYFLTLIARFESAVSCFFMFTVVFFVAMWAIYALEKEDLEKHLPKVKKRMRQFTIFAIVVTILKLFTPSERDIMLIYGIGGTVDYIKQNETAKQLPDKVIMAIDKYLDEQK